MKALWLLVTAAIVLLAAQQGYNRGQREMRQFEALCRTPGVRCVVQFTPEALESLERTHGGIHLPPLVDAEFAGTGRWEAAR